MKNGKTLYDKLCESHTVKTIGDDKILLYIDFHIMNEYTSPQAFAGLDAANRKVWRPEAHLAVVDHVNPTREVVDLDEIADKDALLQIKNLGKNCQHHGIELFDLFDDRQGIEHVVVPENGFSQPGMTIACGDSHTTSYGAFGALGFGIGTSEIEHVLATQTVVYQKLKNMKVVFDGVLPPGVYGKDLIMAFIQKVGVAGAVGYAVEFTGPAIDALSVEGRMTMCNMAVEAGARVALIQADQKVYDYLKGKPRAPQGDEWERSITEWQQYYSDADAKFDQTTTININDIEPLVTWGTSPDQAVPINGVIPAPDQTNDTMAAAANRRALNYMGLEAGMKVSNIAINKAFIGSCTNARIEDLREAAKVLDGHKVADGVSAIVIPGSRSVRKMAEAEGLDKIFIEAGFDWRWSGCSMCLAMNDDVLRKGDRCASSTNRNFEGRQGRQARTHLMSPAMVAAAAIKGHLVDVRSMDKEL